ncbi:hypothetical protein [Tautonia rosea]|uniref:hypothetical protein n=1 Tax=Tautonia rosea TaxID=2728037 RepID=UPI001473A9B2|nr:hypothetical protein [Tautonia rosea]
MRRWLLVMTLPVLLVGFQTASRAQDRSGLVLQPPAEILSEEVHSAPPIPFPPMPQPTSPLPHETASAPLLNFTPTRPIHAASSTGQPAPHRSEDVPDGIQILTPLSGSSPELSSLETTPLPPTTIAPPIGAESTDSVNVNPFLPPGPDQESSAKQQAKGVDRSDRNRGSRSIGPERSGIFGTMFDRLTSRFSASRSLSLPVRVTLPGNLEPGDPASAEALKQHLQRIIIQQEADRIRSIELLIVGTRVHIRAEAARPWQRPALRRELERLPMPPGFHSTVEVR